MTKDELLDVVDELVSGDATFDDVRTAVDAYSAALLQQTPVSGSSVAGTEADVYIRNLMATSKNLIGVIKAKQWERLNSHVWDLENAVELFEKNCR